MTGLVNALAHAESADDVTAGTSAVRRRLGLTSFLHHRLLAMFFALICNYAPVGTAAERTEVQVAQIPTDTQTVPLTNAPQCLTAELSEQTQTGHLELSHDTGWPSPQAVAWLPSLDTIVVLHRRPRTVALVSFSGGELIRRSVESFGRRPPALIGTAGESLLVWNENSGEVTLLNRDLERQGSITVAGLLETHRKQVIAQYPDGDFLVQMASEAKPDIDADHARVRDVFLRYDPSTSSLATLIAVNGQRLVDMQGITVPAPLSFRTTAVVSDNDLFVLEPDRDVLHEITVRGHSAYRFVSEETPTLSDGAKRSMLSLVFGTQAMSDPTLATQALRLPFPETPPLFEFVVGDSGGRLWLRRLRSPDISSEWIVLGARGDFMSPCRVVGPPGLEFVDVVNSTLLGLATDGITASSLRSYRIGWRK